MSENNKSLGDLFPDLGPEVPIISGVAHDSTESLATVRRVPNEPGMAAKVFTMLAEAGVNVDMIVQASASTGTADISFTVPGDEGVNVLMISTSEIRIAALVPLGQLNDAVRALHTAYGLDSDQVEAVVYGGTGR